MTAPPSTGRIQEIHVCQANLENSHQSWHKSPWNFSWCESLKVTAQGKEWGKGRKTAEWNPGSTEQKFSGSRSSTWAGGKRATEKMAWEAQGRKGLGWSKSWRAGKRHSGNGSVRNVAPRSLTTNGNSTYNKYPDWCDDSWRKWSYYLPASDGYSAAVILSNPRGIKSSVRYWLLRGKWPGGGGWHFLLKLTQLQRAECKSKSIWLNNNVLCPKLSSSTGMGTSECKF